MPEILEHKLEKIEQLARGSVLGRFLNAPLRYVSAIGFWRLVYPLTKRGKFARASTFFGAEMDVVLPAATEIYLFGAKTHDSEIRLARFLMKNLKVCDVFCDVGAHFGYFSLLASHLVGENGRVFAFEPSRSTFGILKKNLKPCSNATPLNLAASDVDKTLFFNEFPALFSEYNSLVLPDKEKAAWMKNNQAETMEVTGVRLGDYLLSRQIRPSIIKVDVEGSEPQVIHGLERFLQESSPVLVMEYLTGGGQNEAHRQAVDFAKELGYQVFRITNSGDLEPCTNIEKMMNSFALDSDNIVLRK